MENGVFCRRHAGVVRALLLVPEDEREFPDLDNRAPALCEWIAIHLDGPVTQMLQQFSAGFPGSSMALDGLHLVHTGVPRVRAWEHKWRIVDNTGPLETVGIRVEEPADSLVIVKVNGRVVEQSVPPWITDRMARSPTEEAERRAVYHHTLLMAMYDAIVRQIQGS